MKPISKRTALSALLALSLLLLAACGSTPQATPDPIDDLGSLADANGDIDVTLQVVSVASSKVSLASNDVHSQFTYQKIDFSYKGKPIAGLCVCDLAEMLGVSAVQVRGRVRKVGNVPAFIGFMRSQTAGVGAAAATPPTPVILVAQGKTLPTKSQSAVTLTDLLVSSYAIELNGQMAGYLRTSDGKLVAAYLIDPGMFNLPAGVFQAKLSGQVEWVQTEIGVVGRLKGTLSSGQTTISIEGWLDGMFEL